MRKMFINDLPKKRGKNKNINWKLCVGYIIKFIYDDIEGEVEIVNYNKNFLFVKYKDFELFKIHSGAFRNCQIGKLIGKVTKDFKIKTGTCFKDNKRDLVILDKEYRKRTHVDSKSIINDKWYKYKCNKCGYDNGFITENQLLCGTSCSCCDGRTVVRGLNDIPTTAPWMIPYFQGGIDEARLYTKGSAKKIFPICPNCGGVKSKEMKISSIYKTHSIGCICGDGLSYGHKYIHSLLTQVKLEFDDNKTFNWCKFYNPFKEKEVSGEYDFVIKDIKLIIEVDGHFHRITNKMNGQTKEESKFIDDKKDRLAQENKYNIVRIPYNEYDFKICILNSELVNILDLSNINWIQCEEFALSNRVKEVCKLKKNNPNMTITQICNIMKLSDYAIYNYLKKGTKLGWCSYDGKEERIKSAKKSGKKNNKPIEMFREGVSLGIFESAQELDKQSENLFGVKLKFKGISSVITGRHKIYKGFTFTLI